MSRSGPRTVLRLLLATVFMLVAISAQALEWTERLADINPVPGPINLRGDRGETELFFNLSTRVDPSNAKLHLELTNSQALIEGRSQLVVQLNGVVVAQVPLRRNATLTSADFALPVELLRGGGNRLSFVAAQHYANECESPGGAELWSQIDTQRSSLTVVGRPVETAPTLAQLQDIIGPGLFGGRAFTLMAPVGADGISDATLATGARLSEALALRLRYQPAAIAFEPARADGSSGPGLHLALPPAPAATRDAPDVLLFGTLDELRPMLGSDITTQVKNGMVGVFPMPGDVTRLVLLVTGRTQEELTRAAGAFGLANFPFVDAPTQTIEGLIVQPDDTFFPANHMRPGETATFRELGFKPVTLRGTTGGTGFDVNLPPDLYVPDTAEAELSLDFAYGAGLRGDSALNVVVNGQFQQAIALADRNGAALRGYKVRLPGRKLTGGLNRIAFELLMVPLISGQCVMPETRNLVFSLADTSTLEVASGARYASQPDLRLFAATGFPYVGSAGFDLALAGRDKATVAAGWTLLARLAQAAGRTLPEGRVVVGMPEAGRHAIAVGATNLLPAAIRAAGPVDLSSTSSLPYATSAPLATERPGLLHRAKAAMGLAPTELEATVVRPVSRTMGGSSLGRNALLTTGQAPGGGTFTLTTVTADSAELLSKQVEALVGPQVWSRLEDDVAVWRPGTPTMLVATQRVGPTYHLGTFNSMTGMRYIAGQYPFVWLVAIMAAILLLVVVLWTMLRRRQRAVFPESIEGVQ